MMESRLKVLIWLDSLALAAAAAAGTGVALQTGQTATVTLVIGVMTGCLGGLMRDVVVNEVPLVLRQGELYVSAALIGAAAGWLTYQVSGTTLLALAATAGATLALRSGSLAFGWRLPTYKSRPPRN